MQKLKYKVKAKTPKFKDDPKRRKKRNTELEERALVLRTIESLAKRDGFYSFIDEDTPARVIKSEWDFFLQRGGRVVIVEAKVEDKPLEPHQALARERIYATGGQHYILRFRAVNASDDFYCQMIDIDGASSLKHVSKIRLRDFGL